MDKWFRSALEGPAERRPLPLSVQQITIDYDAIWVDLCEPAEWQPLREALQDLTRLVQSPRSIQEAFLNPGDWNLVHLPVVFEVERLHYLLLARQLSERMQDLAWEEPLSSLLHGLDTAVASAMETGRMLAVEMNEEEIETIDEDVEDSEDVEEIPEWGKGYAYVLYRRYVAEVESILDLLPTVCEEAYSDEEDSDEEEDES